MNKYTIGTIIGLSALGLFNPKGSHARKKKKSKGWDFSVRTKWTTPYFINKHYPTQVDRDKLKELIHIDDPRIGLAPWDKSRHGFLHKEAFLLMPNLELIQLSGNRIEHIPGEMWGLSNLKHLDLGDNSIKLISPNITNLTDLEYLDLSDNPIKLESYGSNAFLKERQKPKKS